MQFARRDRSRATRRSGHRRHDERFVSAAELMSRVLGMPDYTFAVIAHPVSSATSDGLKAMARATVNQLRGVLVQN